jgi:hypothetical protein
MFSVSVLYQYLQFFNIVLFLCMRLLTTFVRMWRWFIVWLLIVLNLIYSYNMLYSLRQCALRIDESEISYVRTYVHIYVCMYVCMCTYIRTCVCVNVCICVCVCVCVRLYACMPKKKILIVIQCRLTLERNKARQKYGEFAST